MRLRILLIFVVIILNFQAYCQDDIFKDYLEISYKDEQAIKVLTYKLVKDYLIYAGLTESKSPNKNDRRKRESKNQKRITERAVDGFQNCFMPNSKIINIASENLDSEHYLDYILIVKTYFPDQGVSVESDLNKVYRHIFKNPLFLEECELQVEGNQFKLSVPAEINVFNGYTEADHNEIKYMIGRLIKLKILILIDKKENTAKIYKIGKNKN